MDDQQEDTLRDWPIVITTYPPIEFNPRGMGWPEDWPLPTLSCERRCDESRLQEEPIGEWPADLPSNGSLSKDSFWVGIPLEAIIAIGEDYPDIGQYLGNIALALTGPCDTAPLKEWARSRYARFVPRGHSLAAPGIEPTGSLHG